MKIAIIADTHDNLANLEKFLVIFSKECSTSGVAQGENRKVEPCGIIHCGDVTTPETLEWLVERFSGPIKLVCGNAEIRREEFTEVASRHKNLEVFAEVGVLHHTEQGKNGPIKIEIAFVHKPDKTEELALSGQYAFVFYGHTHKPWVKMVPKDSPLGTSQGESLSSILVANPGTLGGVFTAPTYAILDTENGQLALHRL